MPLSTARMVAKYEQFQKYTFHHKRKLATFKDIPFYSFLLRREREREEKQKLQKKPQTLELLEVVIAVSVLTEFYFA